VAVGGKPSGLLFDPVLHGFGAAPHLINVPLGLFRTTASPPWPV